MASFRTIDVDFDVHKQIELERRSFTETPNDALRRLLKIPGVTPVSTPPAQPSRANSSNGAGRPWSGKGVTLPHGTQVRMRYNGKLHIGEIGDGEWLVEGRRYRSPSAAAGGVARTKAGKSTSLDGWIYWEARLPGEDRWVPINALISPPPPLEDL